MNQDEEKFTIELVDGEMHELDINNIDEYRKIRDGIIEI
jgi:hypothetical protein